MKQYILRDYDKPGYWPLMSCESRKDHECGDNFGDAECPFCDFVFRREGENFGIGDKCERCGATVTGVSR